MYRQSARFYHDQYWIWHATVPTVRKRSSCTLLFVHLSVLVLSLLYLCSRCFFMSYLLIQLWSLCKTVLQMITCVLCKYVWCKVYECLDLPCGCFCYYLSLHFERVPVWFHNIPFVTSSVVVVFARLKKTSTFRRENSCTLCTIFWTSFHE